MVEVRAKDVRLVPLKDIKLNPKNRNKHSPEQIAQFVKILRYQGNRNPGVISNRSGLLVAGEGRYLAMKEAGETHMPVMFQDFEDEEQEYLYGISDNAIASQAALDLAEIHVDLKDMGPFDLDLLGIKDFQFEPDPAQMPELDSGEKAPYQQMAFILHESQVDQVVSALAKAKSLGPFDSENENQNGNALSRICESFLTASVKSEK